MAHWPVLSSYYLGPGGILLASKSRLVYHPQWIPFVLCGHGRIYAYAYARRMQGDMQGVRPRPFPIRENRCFAEDNKKSVAHLLGCQPREKGHRLDRIVPFLD